MHVEWRNLIGLVNAVNTNSNTAHLRLIGVQVTRDCQTHFEILETIGLDLQSWNIGPGSNHISFANDFVTQSLHIVPESTNPVLLSKNSVDVSKDPIFNSSNEVRIAFKDVDRSYNLIVSPSHLVRVTNKYVLWTINNILKTH